MTFLVDERVNAHYYARYPLANEESHCTASFRGPWLFLQICCSYLFLPIFSMAKTKKTPRKADVEKEKKVREPSKWGTAAQVAFHRPPVPPPRDGSGNPLYKGMNVFNTLNRD